MQMPASRDVSRLRIPPIRSLSAARPRPHVLLDLTGFAILGREQVNPMILTIAATGMKAKGVPLAPRLTCCQLVSDWLTGTCSNKASARIDKIEVPSDRVADTGSLTDDYMH